MSQAEYHPLKFKCFNCGKQSIYPKYLKKGEEKNDVEYVIKRCLTCGANNKVPIPKNYLIGQTSTVLRGLKDE